jgi:hypothetical protein
MSAGTVRAANLTESDNGVHFTPPRKGVQKWTPFFLQRWI